ncbi:MAG: hypothetical protein ACOYOA_11150 [Saprospiraceae bacterium]
MKKFQLLFGLLLFLSSCNVIEKSSRHGFQSGFYSYSGPNADRKKVYLEISDRIAAYEYKGHDLNQKPTFSIALEKSDSICHYPVKFSKTSLDIDITTVLFKFRPGVYNLPQQLTTDFNAAIYTGWRHDNYFIRSKVDPLGKCNYSVINRGYDFGVFAGPGGTNVGPFSTRNAVVNDYNSLILQYGLVGFLESNVASFGVSVGIDRLFSPDRKIWIYQNKPWIGFMVGVALN